MEQVLKEAAGQVPNLVVLAVIVWFFLKSMRQLIDTLRDHAVQSQEQLKAVAEGWRKNFQEHVNRCNEQMQAMGKECHDVQRDGHAAMRENTVALGKLEVAMGQMTETVRSINGGG